MVEVTSAQLELWITEFLWPFFRITGLMIACPIFGHNAIPPRVKVGIGIAITLVAMPLLPPVEPIAIFSVMGLGVIVEQLLIGIAMGLSLTITMAVVLAAGEFIAMQMGLGFATFYSPDSGMNSVVVSRILHMVALLMLLAFNVHLFILEILIGTFVSLPIGDAQLNMEAFKLLGHYASTIFSSGLLLALPMMGSLLMMNLAMGILNRSAPQLTVFAIGFPLTLTAGMILLMIMMTAYGPFLERLFSTHIEFLSLWITTASG